MDRIEFLLELIPFSSPLEIYLPLSQSLLSPPLKSLCDFYPSHVAPNRYSGCMREINLFGSILHSWRTLLLIHTFSFLCRRNHKQEKISWPSPVPSWRRGDESKVKCSSDPLHASKLIFFFSCFTSMLELLWKLGFPQRTSHPRVSGFCFLFFYKVLIYVCMYLTAPGLSCGMQALVGA